MGKSDCILKLKSLLSAVKNKANSISPDKKEIFIFGAGNTSKLYVKSFEAEGIKPAGFLDNDPKKQGMAFVSGGGNGSFCLERA